MKFANSELLLGMSEWERNQMDAEVDQAMRQCVGLIRAFQKQIASDDTLRASDEALHFREVWKLVFVFYFGPRFSVDFCSSVL